MFFGGDARLISPAGLLYFPPCEPGAGVTDADEGGVSQHRVGAGPGKPREI